MAANTFAPYGATPSRQRFGAALSGAFQQFTIKKGYATAIGVGDLVSIGSGGSQGYVTLASIGSPPYLGIFMSVLPYYDTVQQATAHGLLGSWPTSANPSGDVPCLVCTDPHQVFRMQVSGAAFSQTWVGNNIDIVHASLGVPNTLGISTMALDGASPATTAAFPFRVEGVDGVTGGPNDPANTNPTIEVSFNFAALMSQVALGI